MQFYLVPFFRYGEDNYCHLLIIPGPVFSNVCHMWQPDPTSVPFASEIHKSWFHLSEKKEACWSLIAANFLVFARRESNDGSRNPKGHFFLDVMSHWLQVKYANGQLGFSSLLTGTFLRLMVGCFFLPFRVSVQTQGSILSLRLCFSSPPFCV